MEPLAVTGTVRRLSDAEHRESIRPPRPTDREPLTRLIRGTGMFSEAEVAIALELIDAVLDKPGQRDYVIHVYDTGGEVLGYYCIGPTPGTEGTFDLYWIAVDRAAQGTGIGGALDRHARDLVRSMGGRLMIAETSSTPRYDATRQFYIRRGYEEVARIRGYYRPDDDLVVYGVDLLS
jgi:ribosomal protein S18 acetylase RimI-like enzyme